MYIRFKRHEHKATALLYACLVDNDWEAEGPRQQIVSGDYLSRIREDKLSDWDARCRFWARCLVQLAKLADRRAIDAETNARLIRQLADVVPLEMEAITTLREFVEQQLTLSH